MSLCILLYIGWFALRGIYRSDKAEERLESKSRLLILVISKISERQRSWSAASGFVWMIRVSLWGGRCECQLGFRAMSSPFVFMGRKCSTGKTVSGSEEWSDLKDKAIAQQPIFQIK
jgi:hypothetical protein